MNENRKIKSNDTVKLILKTTFREPVLRFDFPGIKIGIGEYEEGPTGCTVFHFDGKYKIAIDIRGGAPGVVKGHSGSVKSVTFSGGSWFGYESIVGVTAELFKMGDYSLDFNTFPAAAGAILYDFRPRPGNVIYPDKPLGRAAIRSAKEGIFPLGNQGAGISATVGKMLDFSLSEKGGQGGAFHQYGSIKILVFSAVNSFGAINDREGNIIRGHFDRETGQRLKITEFLDKKYDTLSTARNENTTLTLVVTNQKFPSDYVFQQVARQIHASMARAIHPYSIIGDGDVLFMVSTEEIDDSPIKSSAFGVLAGEVAWDAVLSCFEED